MHAHASIRMYDFNATVVRNKVITTMVIRPLDDLHMLCSICGRRFGCNFTEGLQRGTDGRTETLLEPAI